jgi:hypothetical protein
LVSGRQNAKQESLGELRSCWRGKKLKLKTGVEMGLAQGEVGDEELFPFELVSP